MFHLKAHLPAAPLGNEQAAVNNCYVAGGGGEGELNGESPPQPPHFSLTASAVSPNPLWRGSAPPFTAPHRTPLLCMSQSLPLSSHLNLAPFTRAPAGQPLKGRRNWTPPSRSFPLRLVRDFVLLERCATAGWLTII